MRPTRKAVNLEKGILYLNLGTHKILGSSMPLYTAMPILLPERRYYIKISKNAPYTLKIKENTIND